MKIIAFLLLLVPGLLAEILPSPCDLNHDGLTNIVDVQMAVNQALGASSCTADLNHDGTCSVADVQRIITAALGMGCDSRYAPVPSTFFGMHVGFNMDWPTVSIGALGKGTGVNWAYIEQPKGTFDWSRLDAHVDLAHGHGVSFTVAFEGCPCWAAPVAQQANCTTLYTGQKSYSGMVSNIQDWRAFVTALATRYKGKINYELWNEPENSFTGECASCSTTAPSTIADMVALTTQAHNIIRSIDPQAIIVAPSYIYPANLDAYYAGGGVRTIDVNSLHGYPDPTNDVAEAIGSFLTPPKQAVFAKYGIQTKPLWDTEGSWGDESAGAITDPDLQMAFVARSFLLHWSLGFSRFIWYMWEDDPGGWGYFLDDQTKILRPAAMAYRQVYNWMVGAILTQPCSVNGGTVYHAMYTCDFTRSSGYQARAVWNTDGASTYTAPSEFTQYRDLAGNTHSMPSNHQVPIGLKPILLENF